MIVGESEAVFTEGTLWEMTGLAREITVIGAGEKTTTLIRLAEEISASGHSVVMTTTTKVYPTIMGVPWRNSKLPPPMGVDLSFWYVKSEEDTGKLIGPARSLVD